MNPLLYNASSLRRLLIINSMGNQSNEYEVTGNPATFKTNIAKPLKQLLIPFSPVQEGSGDPSPENVRPITGWTGLNVTRCGRNILPPLSSGTKNGVTITVADDGTITINGTASTDTFFDKDVFCKVKQRDSLNLYGFNPVASSSNRLTIFLIASIGNPQLNMGSANAEMSPSLMADYTISRYRLRVPSGVEYTNFVVKPMLCISSAATEYEPYTGTTIPVVFPAEAGTVYGGTLDLTTGVLTSEWRMITIESSRTPHDTGDSSADPTWSWASYRISPGSGNGGITTPDAGDGNGFCNVAMWKYGAEMHQSRAYYRSGYLYVAVTAETSLYDMKTAEGRAAFFESIGGSIHVVYKLATPKTFQLTPQQINTLIGDNVIFSDTNGENTIKYLKKG